MAGGRRRAHEEERRGRSGLCWGRVVAPLLRLSAGSRVGPSAAAAQQQQGQRQKDGREELLARPDGELLRQEHRRLRDQARMRNDICCGLLLTRAHLVLTVSDERTAARDAD